MSIYFKSGGHDKIAIGSSADANRIGRLPLSSGRLRGHKVHRDNGTGRLVWCSYPSSGGTALHGYVSHDWAHEQGVTSV